MVSGNIRRSDTTQLDNETLRLYSNAIGYYKLKKTYFLKQLMGKKQKESVITDASMLKEFEDTVKKAFEILSNSWNTIDKIIESCLDSEKNRAGSDYAATEFQNQIRNIGEQIQNDPEKFKTDYNINDNEANLLINVFDKKRNNVDNFIKASLTKNNQENIKSEYNKISGYFYERFIAAAIQYLGTIMGLEANSISNELLQSFIQTGSLTMKNRTATKSKGGLDISSDIATSNIQQKGATFYAVAEADVSKEEQDNFMKRGIISSTNAEDWFNFFNDNNRGNLFGFSAKRWNDAHGREYTQSSVMQKILNASFHTNSRGEVTEKGSPTWNAKYAYAYMLKTLGQYVIALLGPVNIGVFYGSHFQWMDEFISDKRLRMNLYSLTKSHAGKQNEVFPYVASNHIYIMQEGRTRVKQQYTKLINSDTNKPYYKINLKSGIKWG